MEARLRTLITLAVLAVLLLVAAVWGWSAMTEPFPGRAKPRICVERTIAKGDKVSRGDVTVSVYNAGTRNGLAGLTMELLVDVGFGEGREGNAPKRADVERVQIWTDDPRNPAVKLVAAHLGDVQVVRRDEGVPGVMVVVGDAFEKLSKGRGKLVATREAEVCSPPEPAV